MKLLETEGWRIMALWRQGLDTAAIAEQLHVHEYEVESRLHQMIEAKREAEARRAHVEIKKEKDPEDGNREG